MDDAAECARELGFDGYAVAPLAQGDDELLNEGACTVAAEDSLEAIRETVVRDFECRAQAGEFAGR